MSPIIFLVGLFLYQSTNADSEFLTLRKIADLPAAMSSRRWICEGSQYFKVVCEEVERDEAEGRMGVFCIEVKALGRTHAFATRRGIHLKECQCLKNKVKGILRPQARACILGEGGFSEKSKSDNSELLWYFMKMKTGTRTVDIDKDC